MGTQEQCSKRGVCYWKSQEGEPVALESSDGFCKAPGEAQFLCIGKTRDSCTGVCYWVPGKHELKSSVGRCMAHGEAQFLCMGKTQEQCSKRGVCYWKSQEDEPVALESSEGFCKARGEAQFLCMNKS